jgi:hypothetical protein
MLMRTKQKTDLGADDAQAAYHSFMDRGTAASGRWRTPNKLSVEAHGSCCPVWHRRLSRTRRRSQGSGADLLDHLLLQLMILLDVEMPNIGHFLHVDILQHATELSA